MGYIFRPILFLLAYIAILVAPFMMLIIFAPEYSMLIGLLTVVLVGSAVYTKVKRHNLLDRTIWNGRRMLKGEKFLFWFYLFAGIYVYFGFVAGFGVIFLFSIFSWPVVVALIGLMIIGVMLIPRELGQADECKNAI